MKFRDLLFICVILLVASLSVNAQTRLRVEGLKNNKEYVELLSQESALAKKEESFLKIIDDKKKSLDANKDNQSEVDKITNEILNVEGYLFEVRSEQGIVNGKITAIEQEYIIANMSSSDDNQTESNSDLDTIIEQDDSDLSNIFEASAVKKELTAEEVKLFAQFYESKKAITEAFAKIKELNIELDTIYMKYTSTGDKIEGDSLFGEYQKITEKVKAIDFDATRLWDNIYNTKIYVVNRLMDKFSAPQQNIANLSEISRKSRSEESDIDLNYLASNISKYTRQLKVSKEYEKALAKLLNLDGIVEEIEKSSKKIDIDNFDIKKGDLPLQEMILYTPIERVLDRAHSADNPPKELTVPSRGELYKIEIGTYSKELTSYVSFYRVSPVEYYQLESGKFRYWGGSYKSLEDATKDSKYLNRLGMKTSVSTWINGENSEDPTLSVGEYKIEIKNYTSQIRDLVAKEAEGKDILRSTNEEGEIVYSVGIFSIKGEARRVAELIGEDAKVVLAK